jgi:signal recognition particle subunit SRP54
MINSMTPKERKKPTLINNSRRKRIAKGAAVEQKDISQLTKQFDMIGKLSKQMAGMGLLGKAKSMKDMASMDPAALMSGMSGMGGMPGFGGKGNTQTVSPKAKYKKRKK